QTLATAYYAKQRNLRAVLLLLPERPSAEARVHLLAQHALGAEQHLIGPDESEVTRFVKKLPEADRPYVIPTGGSSDIGDVGFVNAGLELADEIEQNEMSKPD